MEFDEPFLLLQDKQGFLSKMVEQTGPVESENLLQIANQTFQEKHGDSVDISQYRKQKTNGASKPKMS